MGTYRNPGEPKTTSRLDAIEDFGASFLKATEIEFVDLKKIKEGANTSYIPVSFFIINSSLDSMLRYMKERIPENMMPTIKEHRSEK